MRIVGDVMKHLAADDVVDVLDGRAQDRALRHAEQCPACQALVDDARRAIELVSSDQIPEPSPLFWTQLSARVGESVRRAPSPAPSWAGMLWGWRAVPVGSLLVLVALVGLTRWQAGQVTLRSPGGGVVAPAADSLDAAVATSADDEPWALVSQLLDEVAADETLAGEMPPAIGSADRAVESMSAGETAELARLLKAQIDEPGVSPY